MGAITEGVVAGLQLRQRKQEFAATQKQQADQFANQLAMRQRELDAEEGNRSLQLFNSLNVMRDRIASDLPTYTQKLSEVDQQITPLMAQLDSLSTLAPDRTAGLRNQLETLHATRNAYAQAASEAQVQKQSIDKALLGLSMRMGGTAQQQPSVDQPTSAPAQSAPATTSEPAATTSAADGGAATAAPAPTAMPGADDLGIHAQILKKRMGVEPQIGGNGITFTANYPGEAEILQKKADDYAKLLGPSAPVITVVDRWEMGLKNAPARMEAQQHIYASAVGDVAEIKALINKPDSDELIRDAANASTGARAEKLAATLNMKKEDRLRVFKEILTEVQDNEANVKAELARAKALADEYYNLMGVNQALGVKPPPTQTTENPRMAALKRWVAEGNATDKEGLKKFNEWYAKNGGK